MNIEQHLNEVIDLLGQTPPFEGQQRSIDIIEALKGYLTEEGTTYEQSALLKEIRVITNTFCK